MKMELPWQEPVKQKLAILSAELEFFRLKHEEYDRVAKELEARSLTTFENIRIRDDFRASADHFAALMRELEALIRTAAVPSYSSTDAIGPLCLVRVEPASVTDEMTGGFPELREYRPQPYEALTWFDPAGSSSSKLAEHQDPLERVTRLYHFKGLRVGATFTVQTGGRPGEGVIVEWKIVAIA
jgi:hypothetical protein